jgi:hypothetical protein
MNIELGGNGAEEKEGVDMAMVAERRKRDLVGAGRGEERREIKGG